MAFSRSEFMLYVEVAGVHKQVSFIILYLIIAYVIAC